MIGAMKSCYAMRNTIRDYAWGHVKQIPEFLNIDWPPGRPAAEVWMGAHPAAPSRIETEGEWKALDSWIAHRKDAALGQETARRYGRLPFLFKLLAAGKSLSIQAHPNKSTAEEGFVRENALGVPPDAPTRHYRDDNHKPEIIMALTPFTAMIGFRDPSDIHRAFSFLDADFPNRGFSSSVVGGLKRGDQRALEGFLRRLLHLKGADLQSVLIEARAASKSRDNHWQEIQREWVGRLILQFPVDVGVLAPLFLHIVRIGPGEAIYQPPRVLHAYLDGFGVELMANSDNVLRGGLTPKNVDVDELLKVLDFRAFEPRVLSPVSVTSEKALAFFPTPSEEFALGIADPSRQPGGEIRLAGGEGPLIVLCLEKRVRLSDGSGQLVLERGQSAFIPFDSPDVLISGEGRAALAEVGR